MSDFFKKALGVFVEFDETAVTNKAPELKQPQVAGNQPQFSGTQSFQAPPPVPQAQAPVYSGQLSQQEIDKFTKHFNDLFDKSNLPGPDYYEFSRMMHMLEAPIPDENTRIAAVFASLSIQGLTKDKVIESAKQYCTIIENDKAQFDKAAADKAASELDGRKTQIAALEKKIADNSQMIQNLTKEITEAQTNIGTLKNEMVMQDSKINASRGGFQMAYQAMFNKINNDIQKINSVLK